ncbi:MAG TPA: zinc-dependent alcohol dehydrogenase [Actinomycetota bacterium]|nr:zinc-dependent alcohol dehydrogenase [Actinomycetota bacterium]
MKAVTWQGQRDVRVEEVPDPVIKEPNDAIVRITSTGICGSDLHLYEVLNPFMTPGDILGHEPMGIVEEVGGALTNIKPGDRVVVPFQICCGTCFMCTHGLQTQCETTQVREHGMGAAIFGYSKLYGQVPGGQAEYLRVPEAQFTPIKVPEGPPDDRFVYLSDVLATAWQAFRYADVGPGDTLVVLGLGPIGDMTCRVALHHGVERVIGVDLLPDRLERVRSRGVEVLNLDDYEELGDTIRDMTGGRGPDAVVDAVGMEAHGSPAPKMAQAMAAVLPDPLGQKLMKTAGVDRLAALYTAIDVVRRGGTISLVGVYGGQSDPLPMLTLFDKQIQLRMGQANVKRWLDEMMPAVSGDEDVLSLETFASHRLPLDQAPEAYDRFQKKDQGVIKVLLHP